VPTLPEIQAGLVRALLDDDETVAAAIAGDGLAPAARLAVYRHHVLTSLTGVLAAAYPVVQRLVGEGFFGYAANRFVRAHPPEGPCLFEYGAAFAGFLAEFPPCADHPYLPDVARLEWAMQAALHAEDVPAVGGEVLGAVPPADLGRLVLRLDPGARWLASPWPVDRIWRATEPDADDTATVDIAAGGARLEIRRRGEVVGFRGLDAAEFAFRAALAAGVPLEDAAERSLDADGAFDVAAALRRVLDEKLLAGVASLPAPAAATTSPDGPTGRGASR